MADNYNSFAEMYNKKTCEVVKAYNLTIDTNGAIVAIIFSNNIAARNNGNGWQKVKVANLIPIDCIDSNGKFISKTKKKDIADC